MKDYFVVAPIALLITILMDVGAIMILGARPFPLAIGNVIGIAIWITIHWVLFK